MPKKIDIEAIMIALENTISELENSKLSLETQLKLFKKGLNLVSTCQKLLSDTEQKIKTLLDSGNTDEN